MSFPEDKKSAASLADAASVDDPWAKWRKPAGAEAAPVEATAVAEKKREARPPRPAESQPRREPRSEAPRAAPARPVTRSEPLPETPAAPPTGTLTVRKAPPAAKPARGEPRPPKRPPLRGGPPRDYRVSERQPRAERPEGAARTDKPRDKAPARPAAENPWAKARPVRSETPRPERAPSAPSTVPAGEAPQGVRLSKVMSTRGLCSRREADLWIERGWVFVNGEQVSELGTRIDADAEVTISREAELNQAKQVTILIHKPVGYVSGQPEPGCVPAVTLISAETQMAQPDCPAFKPWMLRGLAPAGRLDVDSTGLLVLTQDGRVARKLIGEDSDVEKEYLVRVSGQMIKDGLDLLRHGLELDGKPLRQAWVKQLNEDQLHFILKEGKKRQIRRMCELVGLTVIGLKRVRIGRIRLGDLPMGQWRFLREGEAF